VAAVPAIGLVTSTPFNTTTLTEAGSCDAAAGGEVLTGAIRWAVVAERDTVSQGRPM
jgi:hypothetical protein